MTTTRSAARVFSGSEIRQALVDAFEMLDPRLGISLVSAGENMQITVVYPTKYGFNTDAWDGNEWRTIQWD
jgi:hypothetical protein